jgi:hypothetical protein
MVQAGSAQVIDDYLSAEDLLTARIQAVTGIVSVLSAASLPGLAETAQKTPCVHVLYDGDRIGEGKNAQIIHQRWLAVLAIRNARDATGQASREQAGPLLSALIQQLQGWKPSPQHGLLVRIEAPEPAYTPNFAYFPLAFETALATTGATP